MPTWARRPESSPDSLALPSARRAWFSIRQAPNSCGVIGLLGSPAARSPQPGRCLAIQAAQHAIAQPRAAVEPRQVARRVKHDPAALQQDARRAAEGTVEQRLAGAAEAFAITRRDGIAIFRFSRYILVRGGVAFLAGPSLCLVSRHPGRRKPPASAGMTWAPSLSAPALLAAGGVTITRPFTPSPWALGSRVDTTLSTFIVAGYFLTETVASSLRFAGISSRERTEPSGMRFTNPTRSLPNRSFVPEKDAVRLLNHGWQDFRSASVTAI
ncbi:hypothetical protein LPC08_22725 [Roseomonas sp. OT10]|uniref:hypothetical protein n=1 Tax=Roseomonas cutis TaxID=2897332 RepID=UPI001E384936|nr:hypothetical protein [Roseomonas sp. OT10]UFN48783.1 hypothetical protein LPC08_22725 [Roseomonas sp. OT10]